MKLCESCAKKSYTLAKANLNVKLALVNQNLQLKVYRCPLGAGWHLTSQGNDFFAPRKHYNPKYSMPEYHGNLKRLNKPDKRNKPIYFDL